MIVVKFIHKFTSWLFFVGLLHQVSHNNRLNWCFKQGESSQVSWSIWSSQYTVYRHVYRSDIPYPLMTIVAVVFISIKIYQSKVVVVKQLVALEFQWTDQSFEAFWSILKLWWSFYIAILPTRSRPVGASPRRYVGCLKRDLHFVIWNMAKS